MDHQRIELEFTPGRVLLKLDLDPDDPHQDLTVQMIVEKFRGSIETFLSKGKEGQLQYTLVDSPLSLLFERTIDRFNTIT